MTPFLSITRRASCSFIVRHVWKAIEFIHCQRQVANFERIYRYINRVHVMSKDELKVQLDHCLRDGLLILVKSVSVKGYKKGVTLKGYEIPTICERDTHDWYCFECHLAGEVVSCSSCYRVYHLSCSSSCKKTDSGIVCNICLIGKGNTDETLNIRRLNYLLGYVFKNLVEWLPASATQWTNNVSESLLIKYLIYTYMDLDILRENILNFKYNNVEQFQADVLTILHNVVICEGEHSTLTVHVRETINACIQDVKEIKLCADCYQRSHEKSDKLWFCKPCDPPHELVYAQVKSYPFWPAKVIEKLDDKYDVRFFGSYHQRAMIDHDHVKPITVNIERIQKVPKSASWQKASQELRLHQILLKNGVDQNLNVLPGIKKLAKRAIKRKRKTEQKNETKWAANISELKSKYLLHNYLSMKNQNNNSLKRMKKANFPKQRKGRGWKPKNAEDLANNIKDNGENHKAVNFPTHLSVSTQTHCSSHHNHHKYVFDLQGKEIKQEKISNFTEIVNNIMKQPKIRREKRSYSDLHAFCNKYCPLNQYRENIFPDIEVEVDIREAKEVATNLVDDKYNKIVDNLAVSHLKTIAEIKRKRWCVICFQEANIHCCWNVDYCSQKCQNKHYESGHKQKHNLMKEIYEKDLERQCIF